MGVKAVNIFRPRPTLSRPSGALCPHDTDYLSDTDTYYEEGL